MDNKYQKIQYELALASGNKSEARPPLKQRNMLSAALQPTENSSGSDVLMEAYVPVKT